VLSFFSSRDSPTPSPAGERAPSPFGSGGYTLACVRGGWVLIPTRGQTLWYSRYILYVLCVLQTLMMAIPGVEARLGGSSHSTSTSLRVDSPRPSRGTYLLLCVVPVSLPSRGTFFSLCSTSIARCLQEVLYTLCNTSIADPVSKMFRVFCRGYLV
jgi:hypothetical protein